MVNIRDNLERISLITGYAATALAGVTELLPEKEYFSNAPIWGVASAAMAAYIINIATNPDPRHNREYNSAFSKEKPIMQTSGTFNEEKPAMQIYNPSRLEARSLRNETSKKLD
ncbi:hypothetical protein CMI43_01645 [Candidatus Pacearchaeota archaeon]|nr:hypothetical protein [Candidatus Pacearchaeota archaeon]|tara:strand:- start:9360 stop:9701 length:342 start_codon:yes stop_codon:yes gene_type:complete